MDSQGVGTQGFVALGVRLVSLSARQSIALAGQSGGRVGAPTYAAVHVAARSAAAHSRDLFCCVNRVEVIPS